MSAPRDPRRRFDPMPTLEDHDDPIEDDNEFEPTCPMDADVVYEATSIINLAEDEEEEQAPPRSPLRSPVPEKRECPPAPKKAKRAALTSDERAAVALIDGEVAEACPSFDIEDQLAFLKAIVPSICYLARQRNWDAARIVSEVSNFNM